MTDLLVDLDHLTRLAERLGDAANRLAAGEVTDGAALGVERIDRAWCGFRQRRATMLEQLAADTELTADGLVHTRDAYAAVEAKNEGMFAS